MDLLVSKICPVNDVSAGVERLENREISPKGAMGVCVKRGTIVDADDAVAEGSAGTLAVPLFS
jgi:hypothetical protein